MTKLDVLLNPFDVFDRAMMNFKVKVEKTPEGRCRMTVSTLHNTVVLVTESADVAEGERHLREAGFKRIPPFIASDIDQVR